MSHNILFGKLKDYHVAGQKVTFDFEGDKGNLHPSVEMISDTIFNVFIDYDGLGHRTRAIEGELGQRLNNSPSESEIYYQKMPWIGKLPEKNRGCHGKARR